jgi:hypothetical protein
MCVGRTPACPPDASSLNVTMAAAARAGFRSWARHARGGGRTLGCERPSEPPADEAGQVALWEIENGLLAVGPAEDELEAGRQRPEDRGERPGEGGLGGDEGGVLCRRWAGR